MPLKVRVTRDVAKSEEHNYSGRTVGEGEILYRFKGCTYGCVDSCNGIALSEKPDEYPFFEFPADAVEKIEEEQ